MMRRLLILLAGLIGIVLLILSLAHPWIQVPCAAEGSQLPHPVDVNTTRWFQMVIGVLCCLGIAVRIAAGKSNACLVFVFTLSVLFVLAYPRFLLCFESDTLAKAAWLQMQHENLSWFGGDIFRAQEYRHLPSEIRLFMSDSPRYLSVSELPTWPAIDWSLNRLPAIVHWFGYSNTFCQFYGTGWAFAIAGTTLLLFTSVFERGRLSVALIQGSVRTLVSLSLLAVAIGFVRPFFASYAIHSGCRETNLGQYSRALSELDRAAQWWPPLRQDSWYVAQRGLLEHLLGRTTLSATLHQARQFDRLKQRDLAQHTYRAVARIAPADSAERREAARGLLRLGIRSLNSGELRRAETGFRDVLHFEPCSIKALYGLQLSLVRLNRRDVAAVNDRFNHIYEQLRFPNGRIVMASALEMRRRAEIRSPGFAEMDR